MRDKGCKKAVCYRLRKTGEGNILLKDYCSGEKKHQDVQLIEEEEFRLRVPVGRVRVAFSAFGVGVGMCNHRSVGQKMDVGIRDSVDHQSRYDNDLQYPDYTF